MSPILAALAIVVPSWGVSALPPPKFYACRKVDRPPQIDGTLRDPAWQKAEWTDDFVDIESDAKPKPRFRTRAKMLWDDKHLYIGAEMEEPCVWATLTAHDSVIFQDNDFEVFLDPDGDNHHYVEMEMNALNTTWDLLLVRPYRDGGPPVNALELHGMRTAVHVDGTMNDPSDTDRGWSVEIAIPWEALREVATRPTPPADGDVWRINYSRVQWKHEVVDGKIKKLPGPEDNWVWSPIGAIDMHRPERWGLLEFVAGDRKPHGKPLEPERVTLMAVYHAQKAYWAKHSRYTTDLAELGLAGETGVTIETTSRQFLAKKGKFVVDHESRLRSD